MNKPQSLVDIERRLSRVCKIASTFRKESDIYQLVFTDVPFLLDAVQVLRSAKVSKPVKCQGCGEWFTPRHGKRKHCSDSCKTKAYRNRRRIVFDVPVIWNPEPDAASSNGGEFKDEN